MHTCPNPHAHMPQPSCTRSQPSCTRSQPSRMLVARRLDVDLPSESKKKDFYIDLIYKAGTRLGPCRVCHVVLCVCASVRLCVCTCVCTCVRVCVHTVTKLSPTVHCVLRALPARSGSSQARCQEAQAVNANLIVIVWHGALCVVLSELTGRGATLSCVPRAARQYYLTILRDSVLFQKQIFCETSRACASEAAI